MTVIDEEASGAQSTAAPAVPEIVWDGKFHSYQPGPDWASRVSPKVKIFDHGDTVVDPIVHEVLRYRMWTINTAHGATLQRISGSPVLQTLDFNMCILTAQGEVVMNAPYYQHLNSGSPFIVQYILEHFGETGINDGDVFLCNDPWIGVVHQMDVFVGTPVFVDGEIVAWVTNAAHQADLGGISPGGFPQNAPDAFSDPTIFPPIKLVDRGVLTKDVEAAYLRQSRAPAMVAMDLRGQIAGVQFARGEILHACEQFGAEAVSASMAWILDSAQAEFADALRSVPDGTWTQVRYLDESLPGDRGTHRMQINFHKVGDRLRIDNHGTEEQAPGPNGFTFACLKGSVLGGITLSMLYEQLFAAGGADRQIDWDVQPGLLNCVDFPAAVSAGSPQQLITVDLAFEAMSKMLACVPGKEQDVQAQSGAPIAVVMYGANRANPVLPTSDAQGVGGGARLEGDGVDTTGFLYSPLSTYPSTERIEMQYPVLYVYRQQTTDSGGAGQWRGGVGNRFALAPYECDTMGVLSGGAAQSRTTHAAPGLFGGYPAPTADVSVLGGADLYAQYAAGTVPVEPGHFGCHSHQRLRTKTEAMPVGPDDVLLTAVPGGGGLGDPLLREPQRVANDVASGAVSREAAHGIYGVALTDDGEVDDDATSGLRAELKNARNSWARSADRWPDSVSQSRVDATGEPPFRIHPNVECVDQGGDRVLSCKCGQILTPSTENYKLGLLVDESPVTSLPLVEDPTELLEEPMVFRRFCCPACLVLMAAEIARAVDAPYPDVRLA